MFRVLFGLLASLTAARFVAKGWVETLLLEPSFHFFWFDWVEMPPDEVLYGLFGLQFVAGILVMLGYRVRAALVCWLLSFVWVELIDKSLYLNHYVLFTLVGFTLLCSRSFATASLRTTSRGVTLGLIWMLRLEFGLVYFWAGFSKLNSDWLGHAEPLSTWLDAKVDWPVMGPILAHDTTAWAMSWGGMAYDLLVPFLLLWPATRVLGLILVFSFHLAVGLLFPIGIFPFVMMAGALLFCAPDWPRRFLTSRWDSPTRLSSRSMISRWGATAWVAGALCLALIPGRSLFYAGNVNWNERGYRFSWKVLLNEKTGLVNYRLVEPSSQRVWRVSPSDELTVIQHEQMRTQPDMIRDYALHIKTSKEEQLGLKLEVYVDSWAKLNGRPTQRMIRSDVNLDQSVTALNKLGWILPLESHR